MSRRNHRNQQYSIVALTSSSGSVLERYAYSAYGLPSFFDGSGSSLQTSNFAIRTLFTGREWDNDIKQYHYRARLYDASLRRFCSRDPISYLGGINLYNSAMSLQNSDPSGFSVYNLSWAKSYQAKLVSKSFTNGMVGGVGNLPNNTPGWYLTQLALQGFALATSLTFQENPSRRLTKCSIAFSVG
jgi:RHS repeat-associated protein